MMDKVELHCLSDVSALFLFLYSCVPKSYSGWYKTERTYASVALSSGILCTIHNNIRISE